MVVPALACLEVVSWIPESSVQKASAELRKAMREKSRRPAPACSAFFNQGRKQELMSLGHKQDAVIITQ